MSKPVRIVALKYGETVLSEHMILQGGEKGRLYPISLILYLIETEERRILVDAGCDTMPGFPLSHFCGPVAALRQYGLSPEDVTDVVLTHHHHDHAEAAKHFGHAVFRIQTDELPKCRAFLPQDARISLFEEQCELEAGITLRRVGGHTVGSSVVEIETAGLTYVICGDACYSRICLERGIPTGVTRSLAESRAFLEAYGGAGYRVLLAHDDSVLPGRNGFLRIL